MNLEKKFSTSLVIPVYNEEQSLEILYEEINNSMNSLSNCSEYEIIFVDDGSTDKSWQIQKNLATKYPKKVRAIRLKKNFGKATALNVGFKNTKNEIIITLDSDLQDDPKEIYKFIDEINKGYDFVSGWKKDRKDPLSKKIPSKFFNFITRLFTGVKIHDFNCGLKIYRQSVVKTLEIYGGRHRYIPALAGYKNFKVTEIIVNHRPRLYGETKYGGSRMVHGFFDLISILFLSKYTQSPLYFFGKIGLYTFLSGVGVEIYIIYLKYALNEPFAKHMALLMLGVLIIVIGIQFFSIGLVGEMIANSNHYKESRVKEILKS